jgi:hypothetical protein
MIRPDGDSGFRPPCSGRNPNLHRRRRCALRVNEDKGGKDAAAISSRQAILDVLAVRFETDGFGCDPSDNNTRCDCLVVITLDTLQRLEDDDQAGTDLIRPSDDPDPSVTHQTAEQISPGRLLCEA